MTIIRDWLDKLPSWLNLTIIVFFVALALGITFWCLALPILVVANTLNLLWFFLYIILVPLNVGVWTFLFGDDGIL